MAKRYLRRKQLAVLDDLFNSDLDEQGVLDKHGVDGFFNGISKTSMDVSDVVRGPQTGRIRNYVLFAAGVATILVLCLLWFGMQPAQAADVMNVKG